MGRDIHLHTTVYKDGTHIYRHRAQLPIQVEGKTPAFWYYMAEPEGQYDWSGRDKWLMLTVAECADIGDLENALGNMKFDPDLKRFFEKCVKEKRFVSGSYQLT